MNKGAITEKDVVPGCYVGRAGEGVGEVVTVTRTGVYSYVTNAEDGTRLLLLAKYETTVPVEINADWLQKLGFKKVGVQLNIDDDFLPEHVGDQQRIAVWDSPQLERSVVIMPSGAAYLAQGIELDAPDFIELSGVHHLQGLVWHMERTWLATNLDQ